MTSEAKRMLLERAESYSRDAGKFRDGIKGVGAGDCARYALVYRIIADELRKVAAAVGSTEPDELGQLLSVHGSDYELNMVAGLARRAGLLWQCGKYPGGNFCGFDNRAGEDTCGGCGTARPQTVRQVAS